MAGAAFFEARFAEDFTLVEVFLVLAVVVFAFFLIVFAMSVSPPFQINFIALNRHQIHSKNPAILFLPPEKAILIIKKIKEINGTTEDTENTEVRRVYRIDYLYSAPDRY